MQLAVVTKNAIRAIQEKSPVLLTGFAVAGVVGSVVLTVRATAMAVRKIDEFENKDNDLWVKSTFKEKVKLVWPYYIQPAVTSALTISAIVGAQSVNMRRQAALVGAFTLTETAFQEYKDNVIETLGKGKEQKIRDAVAQKQVNDNPPTDFIVIGSGNVLCQDQFTGRYFESTMEKIRGAQNDFNQMLLNGEMYASVNEFYHLIGLEDVVVGEQLGFAPDNLLDINFSSVLSPDGRPCLALSFRALPRQDYHKFQ
jgi:hypothetical protein